MNKKKIGVIAGIMAMTAMTAAMPVMAAGSNYGTTIGGTKTMTFDKYLVMDASANVPNVTFDYAISAGEAKAYNVEGKTVQILAGVDAEKITFKAENADGDATNGAGSISFAHGDDTLDTANAMVKNYTAGDQKYATHTATLDFTACNFTEPGIYRYVITESGTNQGVTNDGDLTRYVDVYVEDATAGGAGKALTIAGYILHADASDVTAGNEMGSDGAYTDGKSQGFTNWYDSSDLSIKKGVAGNQASRDKYFKFTVVIDNATPGTVYDVDLANADATVPENAATKAEYFGKTNPASITIDETGKATVDFYLQADQSIKIEGLAKATTYAVTEDAEDYKSDGAAVEGFDDAVNGTIASDDINTSYLNTRDGVIPTGVMMSVAPFAAVTVLAGAGALTVALKKKEENEAE